MPPANLEIGSILQEPSPLMLAVTHKAMSNHFDMDELYQHLVTTEGNKGKSKVGLGSGGFLKLSSAPN